MLQLAEDAETPLMERVKFLAIYTSNLDEFFMVRVAGLHDQVDAGIDARKADGLSPVGDDRAHRRADARAGRAPLAPVWQEEVRPGARRARASA